MCYVCAYLACVTRNGRFKDCVFVNVPTSPRLLAPTQYPKRDTVLVKNTVSQKYKCTHSHLVPKLYEFPSSGGKEKQLLVAIDFHSIVGKYYGSQWLPAPAWLPTFLKIPSFVFIRICQWLLETVLKLTLFKISSFVFNRFGTTQG